jgi:hypothetical protein
MKSSQFIRNNILAFAEGPVRSSVICIMAVISFTCLLALAGCKKDDKNLETDRTRKLLTANTWTIQSVTVDGVDKTSSHAELTLHFTNTQFTTTHGGVVWPASGIWTFADDSGKKILRSDDVEMTIQEVSAAKLVLTFTWMETTLGPGRLSSTSGEHVFRFAK